MSYSKQYGVKITDPKSIKISDVKGRHRVNAYVSDRKPDAALIQSLRADGQIEPIILSHDLQVVDGFRRYEALKRNKSETIRARILEPNLTTEQYCRIAYGSYTRENLTEAQSVELLINHFGKATLKKNLSRGKHAKDVALASQAHAVFPFMSVVRAEQIIALARRKILTEELDTGRIKKPSFTDEELNFIRNRFKELDRAAKELQKIESDMAELRMKKQSIEKELMNSWPAGMKIPGGKSMKLEIMRRVI